MSKGELLEDLWHSALREPSNAQFQPASLNTLPEAAQQYLAHAIAPGTVLANAVRLVMHGEIRLKSHWFPFSAKQVIFWKRGMVWEASARMHGMVVSGVDRFVDGQASMDWRLFGLFPVMKAAGFDVTHSAAGRMNIESLWLPSVLCKDDLGWTAQDRSHPHVSFSAHGETAEIDYTLGQNGELKKLSMPRWGNVDDGPFQYTSFGGYVEEERSFGGYTIPSRVRVGWFFGTDRFEREGEFFHATIDQAIYC